MCIVQTKATKALSFYSTFTLLLLCFFVIFCQLPIDTTVERGDSSGEELLSLKMEQVWRTSQ